MQQGWIGFGLDGVIAEYDIWHGGEHIGAPIPPMIDTMKSYIQQGIPVKIVTPRVSSKIPEETKLKIVRAINDWCLLHIGQTIELTAETDLLMLLLYYDRAFQIETNTGRIIGDER